MKRSKLLILGTVLGLVFAFHANAYGQDFFVGIKFGLALQDISFGDVQIEYNAQTDITYGFRLGVIIENIGIEASYYYAQHFPDPEAPPPPEYDIERLDLKNFSLNILYFFNVPVVQPYITAGYGTYQMTLAGFDKDRSGGFNIGLGASIKAGKSVSFSAEGKYHMVTFEFDQGKLKVDDFAWNISVNYHF